VPAALAPVVLAVRNLNDFRLKPMHILPAHPEFTSNQSGAVHFAPGDIRVAYNIPSTYTGAGQSIAIMGQSAIVTSDIEDFQSAASLPIKDPTLVLVPGTGSSATYGGCLLYTSRPQDGLEPHWALSRPHEPLPRS